MSKIMQNLVVLMEPSEDANDNSFKAGNMILNRFCIDEDAAFELSGVNYLEKECKDIEEEDSEDSDSDSEDDSLEVKLKIEEKGKEYSF